MITRGGGREVDDARGLNAVQSEGARQCVADPHSAAPGSRGFCERSRPRRAMRSSARDSKAGRPRIVGRRRGGAVRQGSPTRELPAAPRGPSRLDVSRPRRNLHLETVDDAASESVRGPAHEGSPAADGRPGELSSRRGGPLRFCPVTDLKNPGPSRSVGAPRENKLKQSGNRHRRRPSDPTCSQRTHDDEACGPRSDAFHRCVYVASVQAVSQRRVGVAPRAGEDPYPSLNCSALPGAHGLRVRAALPCARALPRVTRGARRGHFRSQRAPRARGAPRSRRPLPGFAPAARSRSAPLVREASSFFDWQTKLIDDLNTKYAPHLTESASAPAAVVVEASEEPAVDMEEVIEEVNEQVGLFSRIRKRVTFWRK